MEYKKLKKIIFFVLFFLLLFFIENCSKKNYVYFNTDSLLVNVYSEDLTNFQIGIPNNWNQFPKEEIELLKKNKGKKFLKDIIPMVGFYDEERKNFIFLSYLSKNKKIKTIIQDFKMQIKKNLGADNFKYDVFTYKNIDFYQFMVFNNKNINLKLVFKISDKIYILDYILTMDYYKKHIKTIESSLSLIKRRI